ncbi:SHOCT domain-containing protein [Natronorubrum texcoconense]|uniref:Short C-terminal domain-containing protein n=1 Tax=Natronorubrum texcoconense TaxID=1095776 RepID=A0A1G9A925_9EURY|nr:SHOCT domain-containing protein [Natronorubrum texcoconense]SDK23115.1 Short C-terminal domain-containing protein [Natronorubrum texcoconense]
MGSESGGRSYSLTEIFAIKFVLADIVIIAVLLLAGPWFALAITLLFVVTSFLIWYLVERSETDESQDGAAVADSAPERDPVTKLQERYAAGELSDEEFETKLDRLIDSNEQAEAAGIDTEELELERSR